MRNKKAASSALIKAHPAEYRSWCAMTSRCFTKSDCAFARYGGRGISMCQRWRSSFSAFLNDMGPRPAGASIDRIDVNADYAPDNCRWATAREQARNRRNTVMLTIGGVTRPLFEWAELHGVPHRVLRGRIRRGYSHESALAAAQDFASTRRAA